MPSFTVKEVSTRTVAVGGFVRVYGAGFDGSVQAWLDDGLGLENSVSSAFVYDYDRDYLDVVCPAAGRYNLRIGHALRGSVTVALISVEQDVAALAIDSPERPTVLDLQKSILGLMPSGFAWFKNLDGNFAKLALGCAYLVDKVYELVNNLRKAFSPSHTDDFEAWFSELDLPERGVSLDNDTMKRASIYRKMCRKGGPTIPYIKSIAALFGIDCDIYEYWKNPEEFSGVVDSPSALQFYWMVRMKSGVPEVTLFRSGRGRAGQRLNSFGHPQFKSLVELIKPAHTKCLYAYPRSNNG